jgi:hypothetical protein
MSAFDVLDRLFQLPNPQIRTALAGPPASDEHPLAAAAVSDAKVDAPPEAPTTPSDTEK